MALSTTSPLPQIPVALLPFDTTPAYTLKECTLKQLHLLSYRLGISSLYARLQQEAVASILMYHSVPAAEEEQWIDPCNSLSVETFEQHAKFLAQYRHVVSIEQLVQQLALGQPICRGTVAITFDDGYRNNLTVAAPILQKYNLPATIYLATGYVDAEENQWIDVLYSAFRARSRHRLRVPSLGDWDLETDKQQQKAYGAIVNYLIEADVAQRNAALAEIDRQLVPVAYPPRLTMNWNEVRALQQQYPNITLGVHTSNHLDLYTHSDQTAEELRISTEHMVAQTGLQPKHLAFPYNRYCLQAQMQVAESCLQSAVLVTNDPVVRPDTSCYELPRLQAPKSMALLKSWTNGGFPDVSQRLFKRAWTHPF